MTWTPTTPEEVAMVLVMPVPDSVRHRTASGTTMKDGGLSVASRRFRHRTVVKPQRKAGGSWRGGVSLTVQHPGEVGRDVEVVAQRAG